METIWLAIAGLAFVVLLIALFFVFKKKKLEDELYRKTGKYPKGHYLDKGVAIGIAIGVALGIALDLFTIGIAVGLAIGYAIGQDLENKHKDELRPLTKEEKEIKKQTIYVMLMLLVLGLIVFAAMFLLL